MFALSANCDIPMPFIVFITCNIQEQKVSLLRSFVETVSLLFLFLMVIFKLF